MEHRFIHSDKLYQVKVESKGKHYKVSINNESPVEVEIASFQSNSLSLIINNKISTVYLAEDKGKKYIFINGNYFEVELEKSKAVRKTTGGFGGGNVVSSPMPGAIVKILVSKGDKVEIGETLVIVEAMKMQNELKSPIKGIVKKVNFSQGDQVEAGKSIVEIEPLG